MKLTDLIHEQALDVRVEEALKTFDWNFDVDGTDTNRVRKGVHGLATIEAMVGALHTSNPEKALSLWEQYCPWALPGSLPQNVIRK